MIRCFLSGLMYGLPTGTALAAIYITGSVEFGAAALVTFSIAVAASYLGHVIAESRK